MNYIAPIYAHITYTYILDNLIFFNTNIQNTGEEHRVWRVRLLYSILHEKIRLTL